MRVGGLNSTARYRPRFRTVARGVELSARRNLKLECARRFEYKQRPRLRMSGEFRRNDSRPRPRILAETPYPESSADEVKHGLHAPSKDAIPRAFAVPLGYTKRLNP